MNQHEKNKEIADDIRLNFGLSLQAMEEIIDVLDAKDAEAHSMEADKVTLAFFRKYLDIPEGTLEQLCQKAQAQSAEIAALKETEKRLTELYGIEYLPGKKTLCACNYDGSNEICLVHSRYLERFTSTLRSQLAEKEAEIADRTKVEASLTLWVAELTDSLSARDVVIEKMDKALGGIINVHMSCEQPTIHQEDECHEMFMLAQKALEISLPAATEELRNLREVAEAARKLVDEVPMDHPIRKTDWFHRLFAALAKLGGG